MAKNTKTPKTPKVIKLNEEKFILHDPITRINIEIIYTSNLQESYNKLASQFPFIGPGSTEQWEGVCMYNLRLHNTIWILIHEEANADVLAHECVHAMDAIMEHHGIIGTEYRAYGVGALIRLVYP